VRFIPHSRSKVGARLWLKTAQRPPKAEGYESIAAGSCATSVSLAVGVARLLNLQLNTHTSAESGSSVLLVRTACCPEAYECLRMLTQLWPMCADM
jgi:hypothetical protein